MNNYQRFFLRFILAFSLLFAFFGCTKEDDSPIGPTDLHDVVFHAGWAPETKTVLQEDGSVWWSPGDEISLFVGNGDNGGYKLTSTNTDPASKVDFVGEIGDNPNNTTYTAIYPYNESNRINGSQVYVTIPIDQIAKEGTFADGALVSVAVSSDENLYFKNVCSGIKFSVAHDNINKVVIKSGDEAPSLGGQVEINLSDPSNPVSGIGTASSVTITAPDGGCFKAGSYYYASLIPGTKSQGVEIEYYTSDNKVGYFVSNNSTTFNRATVKRLYEKDKDLTFYPLKTYLKSEALLPESVDKTKITNVSFFVKSDKTTNTLLYTDSPTPIYFELEGTTANYYTRAVTYDADWFTSYMFKGWTALREVDLSNIETSSVRYMEEMFACCRSLKSITFGDFHTENVVSMFAMFAGCCSLESLDLSSFNTSNVTDMRSMFGGCSSLKAIDLSGFNTEKVTSMFNMFGILSETGFLRDQDGLGCSSLERLDLSMFETSNVTDMRMMFYRCQNLKELNLSGWNTSNVTDMSIMFAQCYSLENLNLSSFNTGNVREMGSMFLGCTSLDSIDLSSFNTGKVEDMTNLFAFCNSLKAIDLSGFTFNSLENHQLYSLFRGCDNLKKIDFGDTRLPQDIKLYGSFYRTARNIKVCAIRCTNENKDIILNSATQNEDNPWEWSGINLDYFTFVQPGEPIPDLPDIVNPDLYRSTDYSDDGRIIKLQTATTGRGVDIVLIGDAYSDRLIKNGTYQNDIEEAMEAIFSQEPYKTFRNLFNVYMVIAVSPNEVSSGDTALEFRTADLPDPELYKYIYGAVKDKYLSDVATVVISHDENCLWGSGADGQTVLEFSIGSWEDPIDFGQARQAISFVPRFSDTDRFRFVVSHEFGHCFAKLADEYVMYDETAPDWLKEGIQPLLGAWRNIDFTSDPTTIKWRAFLNDSRYEGTGVGIFEGGYLFSRGIWRPSSTSIMADNGANFNAPSREAIYNRIHKLAFGYDWVYDYESFVEYDMKNIEAEKSTISSPSIQRSYIRPIYHTRPFIKIKKSINIAGEKIIQIIMN